MEDQVMMDVDDITKLEQIAHLDPRTITKARAISFDSHRNSSKPYLVTPDKQYGNVIISFPAVWTVADFFDPNADSFGLTDIDRQLFPSLKYVGLDKFAKVNQAFQTRFVNLLKHSDLRRESTRGRICLMAAGEWKNQKEKNKANLNMKKDQLKASLKNLIDYKDECNVRNVWYYDAFKLSRYENDFNANVQRLKLAGMWDEIIDMLKDYKLPDNFEADEDWIRLGTEFRRVMEPLDIANFYRHDKNDDTGIYLDKGRPKRYRFTQRWLEHFNGGESSEESCIMAKVEEFRLKGGMKEDDIEKLIEEAKRLD